MLVDRLLVIVPIILFSIYLSPLTDGLAVGSHSWAQSDRYALSIGYVENGLDFFHPQTLVYNSQFPHDWTHDDGSTITMVDPPIHEYLIAIVMCISGNESPLIFRIYNLLWGAVILLFLHRILILLGLSRAWAIMGSYLVGTSPLLLHYIGGFLPTIPAMGCALAGSFYFLRSFMATRGRIDLSWAVLFFTLAALVRATYLIPLVALVATYLLNWWRSDASDRLDPLPFMFSGFILSSAFFFKDTLYDEHGSIFLNHLMTANDLQQFKQIFTQGFERWTTVLLGQFHWVVIGLLLLLLFKGASSQMEKKKSAVRSPLLILTLFHWLGSALFVIAMIAQFRQHDYYFLDAFYLPIVLSVALLLSIVSRRLEVSRMALIIVPIICGALLYTSIQVIGASYPIDSRLESRRMIDAYRSGASLLAENGLGPDSKVLTLDPPSPNLPLICLQRKGYAAMKMTTEQMVAALDWPIDAVVIDNERFLGRTLNRHPSILSHLTPFASNGRLTLCLPQPTTEPSLRPYIDPEGTLSKLRTSMGDRSEGWRNVPLDHHGGPLILPARTEYGPTWTMDAHSGQLDGTLYVELTTSSNPSIDAQLVASISVQQESVHYVSVPLSGMADGSGRTRTFLLSQLPMDLPPSAILSVYIWNTGRQMIEIEEMKVEVFGRPTDRGSRSRG